jgi:RNA polymerase sigma-70 factor (ECF subfamily)
MARPPRGLCNEVPVVAGQIELTLSGAGLRRREHGAEESALHQAAQMERFLAEVECRAFQIARYALRDEDDALDVVQDAMMKLVRRYAQRPPEEWRPLFYRILGNCVRDVHRRRSVRNRVIAWLGRGADPERDQDIIGRAPDPHEPGPERRQQLDDAMSALEGAVEALPPRQREAFLLRQMEGLDVAGTARAMGCSEGSVKTHYSRAVHTLRDRLGDHW